MSLLKRERKQKLELEDESEQLRRRVDSLIEQICELEKSNLPTSSTGKRYLLMKRSHYFLLNIKHRQG